MVLVVVDGKQIDQLKKKYPSKDIEKEMIKKCEELSKLSQESLEKRGFEKGRGGIWIDSIKENVNLIQFDYEKPKKMVTKKPQKKSEEEEVEEDKPKIKNINRFVDEESEIIVEQIYDKDKGSSLCVYNNKTKKINYFKKWEYNGIIYVPQEGEEIEKGAVLLPSGPLEYEDEKLDEEIKTFIKKWLDVPERVIKFGVWNTKRSWVYDKFHTLNYLRALGDTGVGKSRYLNTFGYIHYTPIFTTGATTPAPLFRILDKWGGTLVMDEADLKQSDETDDIIKIINQGFEKGSFIMRCDQNDATKISFFEPYGPKILATRRTFKDKATESRCITHVMSVTERKDIQVNLNKAFYSDSKRIRNKLLMWRFKNFFNIKFDQKYDLGNLEPRVEQIVSSYIALFGNNEDQMKDFKSYIQNYQEDLIEERQNSFEGAIVGAIHSLLENMELNITAKRIIEKGGFLGRTGKPMNPRSLNSYLKALGFEKSKVQKVYGKTQRCIPINEKHINKLFSRYGYEVTVVTVVMETSQFNNKGEKQENLEKVTIGRPLPMDRNNRNSVTTVTEDSDTKSEKDIDKMTEEELKEKVIIDYKKPQKK